jgi:hypothetical protein
MTENKRYEVTARFKSKTEEAKRVMYAFEDPEDFDRERKFSAFEPNLPQLVIGCVYHFTVEDVPTKDGKFYHNLVRDGRDGPYIIAKADKQPAEPKIVPASELGTPKPTQQPQPFSNDDYWRNKDKRDAEKDPLIIRESALKSTVEFLKATTIARDKPPTPEDVVVIAARFETFIKEGK